MGRKPSPELNYPRGIVPREKIHGTRLQLAFRYKGVECRELMPTGPITQTTINLAAGLRAEIVRKISLDEFH